MNIFKCNSCFINPDGAAFDPAVETAVAVATTSLSEGTTPNSVAEFTGNSNAVVFSQTTLVENGSFTKLLALDGSTTKTLLNEAGDITLRSDGRLYVGQTGKTSMRVFEPDMATSYPLNIAGTLTGILAGKTSKAMPEGSAEQEIARTVGLKKYEMKDHLGNVRSVVSDLLTATGSGTTAPTNDAQVLAYYNYYPFGLKMEGRYTDGNGYRYSYNGKEDDNEVTGWQDYGFREYDRRTIRFISPDPLIIKQQKYSWYSPYQFAGNKPIQCLDLDGLEEVTYLYYNDYSKLDKKGVPTATKLMAMYVKTHDEQGNKLPFSRVAKWGTPESQSTWDDITFDQIYDRPSGFEKFMNNDNWEGTEGFFEYGLPTMLNTVSLFVGGAGLYKGALQGTLKLSDKIIGGIGMGFDAVELTGANKALDGTKGEIVYDFLKLGSDATSLRQGIVPILKKEADNIDKANTALDGISIIQTGVKYYNKKQEDTNNSKVKEKK